MTTTAEGVETERAAATCCGREGCTEVQGYLFSRPVPADVAVPALIAALRAQREAEAPIPALAAMQD